MRLIDGLGALLAAVLTVVTVLSARPLLDAPTASLMLRAASGYLVVAALLVLAATALLGALRGSFGGSGHSYEANDRRRDLVLMRLIGYCLLVLGAGVLLLIRNGLD